MKRNRETSSDTLPQVNSIFRGEVASLQPYGIFVNIPGCDKNGLVHISQISNSRVERPEDVVELKEKIYCKVISVEADGQKISLSMKVVNQTTGQDLDPNQLQTSRDGKQRKEFRKEFPKIELGAIFDTVCKKCGGKGHLAQDCFHVPGGKTYELLEEVFEWPAKKRDAEPETRQKHRKKEKKESKKHKKHKKDRSSKKEKKKKLEKYEPSSSSSEQDSSSPDPRYHGKALQRRSSSESRYHKPKIDVKVNSVSDRSHHSTEFSQLCENETREEKDYFSATKRSSLSHSSSERQDRESRLPRKRSTSEARHEDKDQSVPKKKHRTDNYC